MMIISREVNGAVCTFELTPQECRDTYYEQQRCFDLQDVADFFEQYSDKELLERYGLSRDEIEAKFESIADEMRRNIDKYGTEWYEARDTAVSDILLWGIRREGEFEMKVEDKPVHLHTG